MPVNVTRGGKKPLLVDETSNFAEACGVVVPMPVWANTLTEIKKKNTIFFNLSFLEPEVNKRVYN
jgi:hypothetical protein